METLVERASAPLIEVRYSNRDITASLSPYLVQVAFTDKLSGESDELELTLEDRDGRWRNEWYPEKGATMSLRLGYLGETLLDGGEFQVDEINPEGPPDIVTIRGLATGISKELRTRNTRAYESQTLAQVAQQVASRHGLTVAGQIGSLKFQRITQNDEGDLAFLHRLAKSYGYAFTIKGKTLVFHELSDLDAGSAVLVIPRGSFKRYSLRDKADAVYRACTVSYHDPKSGRLIKHTETASGVANGDVLKLSERCESLEQAKARTKAALRESRGRLTEGTLVLPGDRRLLAGNNVDVTDMGRLNGLYQLKQARHSVSRSAGYEVEVEVTRVSEVRPRN